MSLMCSLFGHKLKNGICVRCNKKQAGHDEDIHNAKGINEILPTRKKLEEQIKHDLQKTIESEKHTTNPKFHRTEREEELSFNFSQKWVSIIQKYEDAIYKETEKVGTMNSIDENIEQCYEAIAAYEAFKNYCYRKSRGGQIYFDDMWEHCHNSKNPCFSYIQSTKDYLKELKENYDAYKVRFEKESQLDMMLLDIINNENGILQRKLYKLIPEVPQASIRKVVDELVKIGKVKKEKKGSGYLLCIAKGDTN
ncbi:hypothetical protein [Paenibacillus faecalis]|uniref:hypothetical protein n=1 Tax=Paenibacillus faecalis TaxID=2079532 RepID=UPI000D0F8ED5|nr:hypothetical protein [Paenibacillus faecalis]